MIFATWFRTRCGRRGARGGARGGNSCHRINRAMSDTYKFTLCKVKTTPIRRVNWSPTITSKGADATSYSIGIHTSIILIDTVSKTI